MLPFRVDLHECNSFGKTRNKFYQISAWYQKNLNILKWYDSYALSTSQKLQEVHRSGAETATYRKCRWVVCQICSASLLAGSLASHLETQHDIYCSFVLSRDIIVECPAVVYCAITLTETGCYFCPVANCVGGTSAQWNLCRHVMDCHPQDCVVCPSEGTAPLQRCTRCQTPVDQAVQGVLAPAGATYYCCGRPDFSWNVVLCI